MAQEGKATLQIALTEKVYAYQLHGLVFIIDDLYTSYTWLERAERHTGWQPYGDSEFNLEDFLVVKKVEIGTPNIIELHGWLGSLLAVLTYLGGVGGIVSLLENGSSAYKNWLEARALKRKKEGKSEHEEKMEALALQKAEMENKLLLEKLKHMQWVNERMQSPAEKALELRQLGKASEAVLKYKSFGQEQIEDRLQKRVIEDTVIHINIIPDEPSNEA